MDLVKQATRHLAQGLCLSGQHADRFLRLRADLVSSLLDHDRVAGQQLAQMRRLATERCLDGARMLGEYAIDLACSLAEGSVDRLEPLGERSVNWSVRSASDLAIAAACWPIASSTALLCWTNELVKASERSARVRSSEIAP